MIEYFSGETELGPVFFAKNGSAIVQFHFCCENVGLMGLSKDFPKASLVKMPSSQGEVLLHKIWNHPNEVEVSLWGTSFKKQVWQVLRSLPRKSKLTYGQLAQMVGKPNSSRAVGTAMAKNPLCYIIPCHLVTRSDGELGQYRWGTALKAKLIDLEMNR